MTDSPAPSKYNMHGGFGIEAPFHGCTWSDNRYYSTKKTARTVTLFHFQLFMKQSVMKYDREEISKNLCTGRYLKNTTTF